MSHSSHLCRFRRRAALPARVVPAADVKKRDFCLYCGSLFTPGPDTLVSPCRCSAFPELLDDLEQQEQVDLAAYRQGRHLTWEDLGRTVLVDGKAVRLKDLLAQLDFAGAIRAFPP